MYTAPTEQAAKERLIDFNAAWEAKHPAIKCLWDSAWAEFVPFLDYSPEIRLGQWVGSGGRGRSTGCSC